MSVPDPNTDRFLALTDTIGSAHRLHEVKIHCQHRDLLTRGVLAKADMSLHLRLH